MGARTYQVKDVARLTRVTVRALHHYDEIGLLVPSGRTEAGYRLYDEEDLLRLQQIVIGRELGLSLEEIRRLLDEPGFDRRAALQRQREQLRERARQTEAMVRAVDEALRVLDARAASPSDGKETTVDTNKLFEGFDPAKYEDEASERWGETDSYKESMRRTERYTPEQWRTLKAEADGILEAVAKALEAQQSPGDDDVMDLAEAHRQHIERWFYPCSKQMHAGLADLYEADERFAKSLDKHGEGTSGFLAEAIRRNARR